MTVTYVPVVGSTWAQLSCPSGASTLHHEMAIVGSVCWRQQADSEGRPQSGQGSDRAVHTESIGTYLGNGGPVRSVGDGRKPWCSKGSVVRPPGFEPGTGGSRVPPDSSFQCAAGR